MKHKRLMRTKIGYGEKAKKLMMKEMLKIWMMVDSRHGCARRFQETKETRLGQVDG